jgi:soluble lytic murein transglycosylase-like protein
MERWTELIRRYASLYGVSEAIIYGVIAAESSGNPDSFNPFDPSYGLMGISMPAARDMGYTGTAQGLFDPETNIQVGTKYIAWIEKRWKTTDPAEIYSAYNSGSPTLYQSSEEVSSNVQRFLSYVVEYAPVYGGMAVLGLVALIAIFGFKKKKG